MAWLIPWHRRKSKIINGSTAGTQTNYQMKLILHWGSGTDTYTDVYLNGHTKNDFSDVRFTGPDEATLLSYWIESMTAGISTTIWIKIPSIPASPGTTIFIYYNNPSAISIVNSYQSFWFVVNGDFESNVSICSQCPVYGWSKAWTGNQAGYGVYTGPYGSDPRNPDRTPPQGTYALQNGIGSWDWTGATRYYQDIYLPNEDNLIIEMLIASGFKQNSGYGSIDIIESAGIGASHNIWPASNGGNIPWTLTSYNVSPYKGTTIRLQILAGVGGGALGRDYNLFVDLVRIRKYVSPEPTWSGTGAESLSGPTSQLADTPWPKFAYDIRNTGRRSYPIPTITTAYHIPDWWVSLPSGTGAAPAIGFDGVIYIGCPDSKLYAINPDGTFKWAYLTGNWGIVSSPVIGLDGTIYIGSYDNNLYAINPDGSAKWAYGLGDIIMSTAAIDTNGTIYINCGGKLYAITDLGDHGNLKWQHTIGTLGSASYTPITIGIDGSIYVGSTEGVLDVVSPTNGSLIWRYHSNGAFESCPAISSTGIIYIGDNAGILHSLLPNGTSVATWPHNLASSISSPSLIYTGNIRTVYVATYNGILYAIDTDIDNSTYYNIKWSRPLQGLITASPAIGSDGTICIGTFDGIFYAINPIDGSIAWSYTTFGIIYGPASISPDGVVYVGNIETDAYGNYIGGRLYAFAPYTPPGPAPIGCTTVTKYAGDTVTLQTTPKDGIGPYYVEFKKGTTIIASSSNVIENTDVTYDYILTDADIAGSGGTITFSVFISDSCPSPLGPKTCTKDCTMTIGCIAPVCNFAVT